MRRREEDLRRAIKRLEHLRAAHLDHGEWRVSWYHPQLGWQAERTSVSASFVTNWHEMPETP